MNQFIASIVLAVLVSSAATYLLTTTSLQSAGMENKSPSTAEATDIAPPKVIQQIESETKSWITSKTTKIELSCLESCDDGNACTYDYCNKTTDFKCAHTILRDEVEGCKGQVEGTCYKNSCVSGICTLIYSSTCCGNGKCDEDEDYSLCPRDCEQTTFQQTTTTAQPSTNQSTGTPPILNVELNQCFSMVNFHYDAEGNDNSNLNDEYVSIKNGCDFTIDMSSWIIKDSTTHTYTFSSYIINPQSTFTLYTGTGTNTQDALYWGKTYGAVWNNDADTLYLKDQNGNLIFSYSYPELT